MSFLDFFGSGSSSGKKSFSKVKTTTTKTSDGGKVQVRSISSLITGDSKGTHETVYSKSVVDIKTGKSFYEEGWHGEKSNK